ncbi:MAG: DUF1980 domain-containing protein [Verrucomicrobiota bacterium]
MKKTTIIGAVSLLVWGLVMVYFYQSGRVSLYLTSKGIFQPLLLFGGIGLTLVAIFNFLYSGKQQDCGHDHGHHHDDDDHDHDHDHVHETPSSALVSALILSVPVSAAALLTPDRYSANFVELNQALVDGRQQRSAIVEKIGSGSNQVSENGEATDESEWEFTIEDLERNLDKNERGAFIIGVDDLFYTAGDVEIQRILEGQPVESTGQLLPESVNNPEGRRIRALKMSMTCCAADMRPMSLPVEFESTPPDFVELNWYKIHGVVHFEPAPSGYGEDDYDVPYIEGLEIEATEEPENPYGF